MKRKSRRVWNWIKENCVWLFQPVAGALIVAGLCWFTWRPDSQSVVGPLLLAVLGLLISLSTVLAWIAYGDRSLHDGESHRP
jgi:hypothetical protein